jgi:hypothetical protein
MADPEVTIDDVRRLARSLPRSEEHLVRGRVKFRVGQMVYLAFSRDEAIMEFAFPREWRAGLVEAQPDKFLMPSPSDERFNWVCVRLAAIAEAEMRVLVTEAWRMVVPARVAATVTRAGEAPASPPSPRRRSAQRPRGRR